MDQRHLTTVGSWLRANQGWLDALDQAIRASRGPRGLPIVSLFAGLLYNLLDHQAPTITAVHSTFAHKCSSEQRSILGLPPGPVPSVHAFYRTLERLKRAIADGLVDALLVSDPELVGAEAPLDAERRLAMLLDCIVRSTVPSPGEERLWSADTTYIDANCRPISRARYDAGERASDPDASGRRLKRPNGVEKQIFGYAITTVVRSEGTREFVDALRVDTASAHDRPKVVEMARRLTDDGYPIERLAIDRGIKSQDLNAGLRAVGIEPVFDFDANEGGLEGAYRGLLIVDGWLYSPALPERLRQPMAKPLPVSPDAQDKAAQWKRDMEERDHYAWRVRQTLGPGKVQLYSPLRVGCQHPTLRHTMRNRDLALATCPGDHDSDEACGMETVVWEATRAPISWQNPHRGSRRWQTEYAKRSSVERGYSLLKSSDLIQLKNKAIKLRGRIKFALMVAIAFAATNLHRASLTARSPVNKQPNPPIPRAA